MTTRALGAGPTRRRRAFFGLLDADGWGWATVKAFFWLIVIIFLLGYLPDRAYYFTVNRTLDLGILAFSPVNFCPPENETLPCPAPQGAVVPWQAAPRELALAAPRTDGAAVQLGSQILYVGGSDGNAAVDTVHVARVSGTGNFDRWTEGPALPEPRSDAGVVFLGGSIYAIGGRDADGAPTDTTFVLTPDPDSGDLGEWQTAAEAELPLDLPEPRAGAAIVALGDGIMVAGGEGADGRPTASVWKSTLSEQGQLGEWTPQPFELAVPVADAVGAQNGDYLWIWGGTGLVGDSAQPVAAVQRGTLGAGESEGQILEWSVNDADNLPEARTNASGWAANGVLYLVGGSDGSAPRSELYWASPVAGASGDQIGEWHHLAQSDLPAEEPLVGAAPLVSGPNVILIGGTTDEGVVASSARADLAPQEPFFRLGIAGMVVPALKIEGEIGQQLGYLNASAVGGLNFALLVIVGWMFSHREQTRAFWYRLRHRRR